MSGLRTLADHLLRQVDHLLAAQCRAIRSQVGAYQDPRVVSDVDLFTSCRSHVVLMLEAVGSTDCHIELAQDVGRKRAQQGIPLADVLAAYRVGLRFWWQQIVDQGRVMGTASANLVAAATETWQRQAEYTTAMTAAYREVAAAELVRQEHARSALVMGLIDGRLPPDTSAWDAIQLLNLPESGHLVVAVARLDTHHLAQPNFEQMLNSRGFASAWRYESDVAIGLVSLSSAGCLTALRDAFASQRRHRVGVSPLYEVSPPFAEALKYARTALSATTEGEPIIVFDQDPHAVAAVSDPITMKRYAQLVLGSLNRLNPADKKLLVETFLAWMAHDGSVAGASRVLSCHPNTVRYRLRRLAESTGRDVLCPRDAAELYLAVEADRRLRTKNENSD